MAYSLIYSPSFSAFSLPLQTHRSLMGTSTPIRSYRITHRPLSPRSRSRSRSLSRLVLSCLVLSWLGLAWLLFSSLLFSSLVLSCLLLSCLVLSCLVLSCLVCLFLAFRLQEALSAGSLSTPQCPGVRLLHADEAGSGATWLRSPNARTA